MFADEAYDELYIYYNHYVSKIQQEVAATKVLPLTDIQSNKPSRYYEFEPSEEDILKVLLPQYAESLIYGALLDGKASEHAARMTAMKKMQLTMQKTLSIRLHFPTTVHVRQRLRKKLRKSSAVRLHWNRKLSLTCLLAFHQREFALLM
ncbi:hypothetical protein GCM10020331_023460 [Ectobacillus funiculus]